MNYVPNILCTVWEKFVEPLLRALIKIHSHLAKKNISLKLKLSLKIGLLMSYQCGAGLT